MKLINNSNELTNELNESFLIAVKEASLNVFKHGSTSPKKVVPLHVWIAKSIEKVLGKEFICFADGYRKYTNKNGKQYKEVKIKGKYFNKNVDVAIMNVKNKFTPIGVVEIKFHSGNLSQNENNNLENMLGYTANVRGNNMMFAHFIVAKSRTPYFNKSGELTKMENHSIGKWEKYKNILKEPTSTLHRPDSISINLVEDGSESFLESEIKSGNIIKDSKIWQKAIEDSYPRYVATPNIDEEELVNGPSEFIYNFCIKLLTFDSDNY